MIMLKALIKKQFLELNSFYFQNKKTGKNRSAGGVILMVVLFAFLFLSIGFMFYEIAGSLCLSLVPAGMDWLMFAMMGMMSIALGTFGSVFNTYSMLYKAKDNELLISMPVPPSKILISRMTGVLGMSLLYSAIVWVPSVISYWIVAEPGMASKIFCVLLLLVITLIVSVLTCVLGWVVALISGRLKNKSFFTVLFSLLFLGVYYFVYFRINTLLQSFSANSEKIGSVIRKIYPVYQLGLAGTGEKLPMLLVTAGAVILFAICVAVLSKSFVNIITSQRSGKKKEYKEKAAKVRSASSAIFGKELTHFLKSPTYMLNCGLGLIILTVLGIYVLISGDNLLAMVSQIAAEAPVVVDILPAFGVTAVILLISMNNFSAPSVSLEGKSIWVLQSMPVDGKTIFTAKAKFHIYMNIIPVVFAAAALGIVFSSDVLTTVMMVAVCAAYCIFSAVLGLTLNMKMPNLTWTNEAVPVKQSAAVGICIFGGWAVAVLFSGGAYLLTALDLRIYMLIFTVILLAVSALLWRRLTTKGAKEFFEL